MSKQKGFVLFGHCMPALCKLSDEQAGKVIKAACRYFLDGETSSLELAEDIVLSLITQCVDESNERYEEICRKRSEAGKKHTGNQYTRKSETEENGTNGTNGTNRIEKNRKEKKGIEKNRKEMNRKDVCVDTHICEARHTHLTPEQLSELFEEYGEATVQEYIDRMDEYIEATGAKPYSNHYSMLKKWMKEDGVKKLTEKQSPSFDINEIMDRAKNSIPTL